MNSDKNAPRLLGAAFLFVALVPLIVGIPFMSAVGSGSISDILINISNQLTVMRISILGQMVTSSGIVVLAGLLYFVLNKQHRILALVALGSWLGEAMFLAISQVGVLALLPLSLDFVKAGAPEHSYYQAMGEFLYNGVYNQGYHIHMWFYCTGGILWYYLFYKSRYVPHVMSLFGLLAVSVAIVGIVFEFFGYAVPIFVYLPLLPFELTIGVWLLLMGIQASHFRSPFPVAGTPTVSRS
jgi:uncharacterized protein DUF4386